ncbi:MAG: SPFH domain-containing protein [Bacteroidaceae bacterium]|nr:SPFH domain-containing protein [Bacteroidaceae bacterium]
METKERDYKGMVMNGFLALLVNLAMVAAAVLSFVGAANNYIPTVLGIVVGIVLLVLWFVHFIGFMTLEPNEARVMVFFGKYKGTFRQAGFYWVNPFLDKKKVSLRARNLNPEPIKVNDLTGNPIMIGVVLVWKLKDTYKALFEIDSQTMALAGATTTAGAVAGRMRAFENFVRVQSDAALRQVAGRYAYDDTDAADEQLTLRSNADEINQELVHQLNERLSMAGIEVVEARINYLAYAPEIAAIMLKRQQASAIITAREKIVEGAVSMVKLALDKLSTEAVVDLDEEKKAAMVSNLLVVLCADEPAQPVINSGTLNH